MSSAPRFAVVGRANKGKSSIVAALAEDERVAISPIPGTTVETSEYPVRIDGEEVFVLVDTPGFEDAPRALAWLRDNEVDASSRAKVVAAFVAAHEGSDDFGEECRLLRPILAGASILYVVDGTKPYRKNHEAEMEILRWTGRPGMALINRIGTGDFTEDWRNALDQYFRVVRDFDAFRVTFTERMRLLTAFRELRPEEGPAISRAIAALRTDRAVRRQEMVRELARLLADSLTFTLELSLAHGEALSSRREEIERRFCDALRDREQAARRAIERLYKHHRELFVYDAPEKPFFDEDLFSTRTWRLGLTSKQMIAAHAAAGALIGGGIDAMVGGVSFGAGTAIGGAIGLWRGSRRAAQRAGGQGVLEIVNNIASGKTVTRIGPLGDLNFPFVLLDRAILHYRSILTRTHADRNVIPVVSDAPGYVAGLPIGRRKALVNLFQKVRRSTSGLSDATAAALHDELRRILDEAVPEEEAQS